jgi:co-chaperonin GroES (HSP10)
MTRARCLNDFVLVKPMEASGESFLIVPDHVAKPSITRGIIVAVSAGRRLPWDAADRLPLDVEVSDEILYLTDGALSVTLDNEALDLIPESCILLVLEGAAVEIGLS